MFFLGQDVQNKRFGGITGKVFWYKKLKCPACDKICRSSFGKAMHIERFHPDIESGIEPFEEPLTVELSDENEDSRPPSPDLEPMILPDKDIEETENDCIEEVVNLDDKFDEVSSNDVTNEIEENPSEEILSDLPNEETENDSTEEVINLDDNIDEVISDDITNEIEENPPEKILSDLHIEDQQDFSDEIECIAL